LAVLKTNDIESVTKPPPEIEGQEKVILGENGIDETVFEVEKEEKLDTDVYLEEFEDEFSAERFTRVSASPPCGLRERTLLCPIQVNSTLK